MSTRVTQLSLVTTTIAARLSSALHSPKIFPFKSNNTKNLSPTNRLSYVENAPPRLNVRRWTGEVADVTGVNQTRVFGTETFRVGGGFTTDFQYGSFEQVRDIDQAKRDTSLESVGIDLAHQADADTFRRFMTAGSDIIGTFNTPVSNVAALYAGVARLRDNGVTADLYAVLPFTDQPTMARYLTELPAPTNVSEGLIKRMQGLQDLAGVNVMFSSNCPILINGTRTNGTVAAAGQNVNYSDVAVTASTINGNFLTATLNVAGVGANATINAGEIFTIAGVNSYDNRRQGSRGRLQEFTVTENAVATAGGAATIRYFPAMIVPGGALNGVTGVNTAHATVTAAPAAAAPVNFVGAASAETVVRAVMTANVGRIETYGLDDLPSGETSIVKMGPMPLSLRGHKYSFGDTGITKARFDCPWEPNINVYGRSEVCRIYG